MLYVSSIDVRECCGVRICIQHQMTINYKHIHIAIYIQTGMYKCIHTCCLYLSAHTHMHMCMYSMYTHSRMHKCIILSTRISLLVCPCTYVYVHTWEVTPLLVLS